MKLSLAALFAATLFGQALPPTQFEVASIKPSAAGSNSVSGVTTGHGRLRAENVTLKRCIMGAYRIAPSQIVGGPDWLDSDRFDIVAKVDQPVGDAELMTLLQALMADRFKLTLHHEKRTMAAYVLEVAKGGAKLEKSPGGESSTNNSSNNLRSALDARNTTMDRLAEQLGRVMDLPVVDHTGLEGLFNLKLEWIPERAREKGDVDGPSIFTALQEQLGLRLHVEKAPVDVLVIDGVEKPTEN
jgi:uncharacterized protein (TIGR03435 family)